MHGKGAYCLLLLPSFLLWIPTESLECFHCINAHNVSECHSAFPCAADEKCFTESRGIGSNAVFNLGCRKHDQCVNPASPSQIPSIVGRDSGVRAAITASTTDCTQCCSVDYCNKQLCNQITGVITNTTGQCHDDPDYNCELISGTFNVCGDVQHAKSVCRKWCGLCDFVDGGWSAWSPWSLCDVTCNQGHKSRFRNCTEPTPSPGGLYCVGNNVENSICTLDQCPVHGAWSLWSSWGSCSTTCGVGLDRRDRSCDNPYPGPNGNHCYGDARDDRVCFTRACADGVWSVWSPWSTCSATCSGGMTIRSRTCDNPPPSMFGRDCIGNSKDFSLCNTQACPAGTWSTWTSWSTCSATCNGGLMTRSRSCDNLASAGKDCNGNNVESTICNAKSCPDPIVYFAVSVPVRQLVNSVVTFSQVDGNQGNGYNQATGQFQCHIPGLYQFSVAFQTGINHSPDAGVGCHIRHNTRYIVEVTTTSSTTAYKYASASTNIYLASGDTVDFGVCLNWNYVETDRTGMFSGVLITST